MLLLLIALFLCLFKNCSACLAFWVLGWKIQSIVLVWFRLMIYIFHAHGCLGAWARDAATNSTHSVLTQYFPTNDITLTCFYERLHSWIDFGSPPMRQYENRNAQLATNICANKQAEKKKCDARLICQATQHTSRFCSFAAWNWINLNLFEMRKKYNFFWLFLNYLFFVVLSAFCFLQCKI